jgi:hypothetical protein
MFYVVITQNEKQMVVTDSDGQVRAFPKLKKAKNFIDGRLYLKEPQIATEIDGIKQYFKVDL